jgi:RNA polymerase-associated protein LEO1
MQALEQRIRSREDLHRKQEKISRKYTPAREREPQLSPGYLEEALEEVILFDFCFIAFEGFLR